MHAGDLLAGPGRQAVGGLTGCPPEVTDLGQRPVDRLVVRVAELLDHAHAGALGGARRQHRGRRVAVLEVLENDRRVENVEIAVDEAGHFPPRTGPFEGGVGAE